MVLRENLGRSNLSTRLLLSGLVLALTLGFSTARADAAQPVTLLIAAKSGHTPGVVAGVRALGGTVTDRKGRIGYVKAKLPAGRIGKVSGLAAVKAVDVDRLIPFEDPVPQGQTDPLPQDAPDSTTPRTNPYMPIQDTGADTFTANPLRDGRGTTIAILDTGVDLANPALQSTTTSAPKVIDVFDANPPGEDGTWVATEGQLNDQFVHDGHTWTAPSTGGPFAFGTLVEDRLDLRGGALGGDLDRDGIKGETIGVLQDRETKEVLVDTDQDLVFTDETPMTNFPASLDVGTLGEDDPGTAVAEELTFSVRTDESEYVIGSDEGSWVGIGIAGGSHGSHVAGITAANGMFGGAMGGAAPGAQIISVQVCLASAGCLTSAMMDGMIYAAEHGADVANLSVGGLPALNDGNSATTELYNRLIEETGMQIFIAAGNEGSGANTVGEPGNTAKAVSVGASIAKETWLSNYGATVTPDQMLMPFSSRGPSESGAMKPDLLAPGSAVSTIQPWLPGSPVAGTFNLPPGYAMYNGTSMASPQATGAAALLVGAYKHKFGSPPAPDDLRNAMISTAGFLLDEPAHGQGTGLIDVEAAWSQLSQADPVKPPSIEATVPVNSVLSEYLEPAGTGSGIYEREGLKTGDEKTRTYTLTRTSGDPGAEDFDISWKGNDGTFTAGAAGDPAMTSVTLPLGTPVQLPVQIKPTSDGIHSAVLQLDDPATNGIDLNTQNVAFSTADLDANWSVEGSGTVGRGGSESVLIDVPDGASALRVELDGGGPAMADGQVRFQRLTPAGEQLDPIGTRECFIPAAAGCSTGLAAMRVVEDPAPGVWEIAVEGGYRSSVEDSPWDLTATVLDASVSPDPDEIRVSSTDPVSRSYEVTNEGGPFTGFLAGGSLASTHMERLSIAPGEQPEFEVDVPEGAESVGASIGNAADLTADIDLYLLRCAGSDCEQVAVSGNADSEESVRLDDPPAGDYVVVLDPYDLSGGSTQVDYTDSFTSPEIGEVTTDDTEEAHATNTEWTVGATITPGEVAPAEGRTITGELRVVDDFGSHIGSGAITLDIDTTAPKVSFTAAIPGRGDDRTPTFEFHSDDPDATYECRVDDQTWAACTSPHTTTELSDGLEGDHTFTVRASDGLGNTGGTSADFTVVAATTLKATAAPVAWHGRSTRISPSASLMKSRDGESIPGQMVTFFVHDTVICQTQTNGAGQARCSRTLRSFKPRSTSTYRAVFGGERRLKPASSRGPLKKRTGVRPDRKAPRFIGKIRLKPRAPKAGKRARIRFRVSERAKLRVRVGGKVVRKRVTRKTRSVRLPRLKRRRYRAKLILVDRAKNRSKRRTIRFRVR